jgi:ferritin-like metal-binding protein YciE
LDDAAALTDVGERVGAGRRRSDFLSRLESEPDEARGVHIVGKGVEATRRPKDGVSAMSDLQQLFEHTLKDIYFAEKQIVKTLPKLARKAQSSDLKDAFETHQKQTEEHIERLEQIFKMIGKTARTTECKAIERILEEGDEVVEMFADTKALDAGLIAAAQAVEHYEIARYGALATWAEELELDDAAELLRQTLQEERETDELLSDLAVSDVNQEAAA